MDVKGGNVKSKADNEYVIQAMETAMQMFLQQNQPEEEGKADADSGHYQGSIYGSTQCKR